MAASSYGYGSDLGWPWLRPAAATVTLPLAQELPRATGMAVERKEKEQLLTNTTIQAHLKDMLCEGGRTKRGAGGQSRGLCDPTHTGRKRTSRDTDPSTDWGTTAQGNILG